MHVAVLVGLALLAVPDAAAAGLSTRNNTPFPSSGFIVGAKWTTRRHGPPRNQFGDILPTIFADDGNQYTMIDDGATDGPSNGAFWKQSLARIRGVPLGIRFSHVGDPNSPPPATGGQIHNNHRRWTGPLGPYYSCGLVVANHIFYATQQRDWNWNANSKFSGLVGIAYSSDNGATWKGGGKSFPAPLGNLNWVIRGRGGHYPDGWVYAIATEREFNASRLIMGRARPRISTMTDFRRWEWLTGWTTKRGQPWPVFTHSFRKARPIVAWAHHITYPQMAYDSPLHRYLLTFTYSYSNSVPGIWRNGSELVMLESRHPWGPFSFVAREGMFGPSNGYSAGIPIHWISGDGRDIWLKWAANFNGCASGLNCSGGYGFNYARIHLKTANSANR